LLTVASIMPVRIAFRQWQVETVSAAGSDYLARSHKLCYGEDVIQTKGTLPVSEVSRNRSPEERNIRKQLGKVRRYLAKSTTPSMRSSWESRIATYEKQLVKAEARARLTR